MLTFRYVTVQPCWCCPESPVSVRKYEPHFIRSFHNPRSLFCFFFFFFSLLKHSILYSHTHTHVHTERESLNLLDVNFLTVKSCLGRRKSCLGRRKMRQRKVQAAKVHAPLRPSPCVYSGIDAGRPIEQARRMTTPPSNGNTTSCFIGLITI